MSITSPFYVFERASKNSAFESGSKRIADIMATLKTSIDSYSPNTKPYPAFSKWLKNEVDTLNSQQYQAGITIEFPSPFPTLVGANSFTVNVLNKQLSSFHPTKTISIALTTSDLTITANVITFDATPLPELATYDKPVIAVEDLVAQSLRIREMQGSSFLPETFKLIAGVAVTGLANADNWIFDSYPKRQNAANPAKSANLFFFDPLQASQRFPNSLTERIIQQTIGKTQTYAELEAIVDDAALMLPDGWTYSTNGNTTDFLVFKWIGPDNVMYQTVAQFNGYAQWQFQRFISLDGDDSSDFVTLYSADALPIEPDTGLTNQTIWYDFDFCVFEGIEKGQEYHLPIKTGDNYQFNVLPEFANMGENTTALVGLLSCDGALFQPNIGTATLPVQSIYSDTFFKYGVQIDFNAFKAEILSLLPPDPFLQFNFLEEDGSEGALIAAFDLLEIDLTDVDAFVTWLNGLTIWPEGVVFEAINDEGNVFLSFTYIGIDCFFGIGMTTDNTVLVYNRWDETDELISGAGTQYQIRLIVPSMPYGLYRFVLYNVLESGGDESLEVYSVSQPLLLNNKDTYSQILEYWVDSSQIKEGFEYVSGWKQRVRVPLNGAGHKPIINEAEYRNSDGTYQRPNSDSDLSISLQTDDIDLQTQKAMFAATRHDNFVLGGQSLFVRGDLDVATTKDYSTNSSFRKLSQMTFEAIYQGFQPNNNSCLDC